MLPKTTYLLGAGASAMKIPVVAKLAEKVDEVFKDIMLASLFEDEQGIYQVEDGNEILVNFKDLYDNWDRLEYIRSQTFEDLSTNLSVDTVAKLKYTFDKDNDYRQLKAILVACFLYWEVRNGLDPRYANFWATLAEARKPGPSSDYSFRGFKGNVNIVSWNYDSQLENSLAKIMAESKWATHGGIVKKIFSDRDTGFNPLVYKLNGSARLSKSINLNLNSDGPVKSDWRFRYALASIILFPGKFKSLDNLCYSWEESTCGTDDIELAKAQCADTNTLVVIGYSFPTLNISADYSVIDSMSPLKKVFFQGADLEDSIRIKEHFLSIFGEKEGITYKAVQSAGFFIPVEVAINRPTGIAVW
jgi:hypothetical protein